jgi:hypothetical protein
VSKRRVNDRALEKDAPKKFTGEIFQEKSFGIHAKIEIKQLRYLLRLEHELFVIL